MSDVKRHSRFKSIPGLDKEFNSVINQMAAKNGKVVTNLPPVNTVSEMDMLYHKQSDGTYNVVKKIEGKLRSMYVDENGKVYFGE